MARLQELRRSPARFTRSVAEAVFVCGFSAWLSAAACAQNTSPSPALELQQARELFVSHIKTDQENLASAESLLSRAQAAHSQVVANNSIDGISITSEAISNVWRAIDRDLRRLAEDQLRPEVIDIDHVCAKMAAASVSINSSESPTSVMPRKTSDFDAALLKDMLALGDATSAKLGPKNLKGFLVNPLTTTRTKEEADQFQTSICEL